MSVLALAVAVLALVVAIGQDTDEAAASYAFGAAPAAWAQLSDSEEAGVHRSSEALSEAVRPVLGAVQARHR